MNQTTNQETPTPRQIGPNLWEISYQTEGITTHLTGRTKDEVLQKVVKSHISATRHINFLKNAKLEKRSAITTRELSPMEQQALEAKLGAQAQHASYAFLSRHLTDYNNCDANNAMLKKFIDDSNLEWNTTNLEHTYQVLSQAGSLVPTEHQRQALEAALQRDESEIAANAEAEERAELQQYLDLPRQDYATRLRHDRTGKAFGDRVTYLLQKFGKNPMSGGR